MVEKWLLDLGGCTKGSCHDSSDVGGVTLAHNLSVKWTKSRETTEHLPTSSNTADLGLNLAPAPSRYSPQFSADHQQ